MLDHEILTIEEVAQYLRVSERTVYDWAHRGEIPCGKIGTTWRFRRAEVEAWISHRLSGRKAGESTEFRGLEAALPPHNVLLTREESKEAVLGILLDCLSSSPEVTDPEALRREMMNRERIMSTGMGHGLGVPHVRLPSVRNLVMAVGVNDRDIVDYVALDDRPVRVVCMVAAHDDQHTQYLRTLAAVSTVLRDPANIRALQDATTAEEARAILLGQGQASGA